MNDDDNTIPSEVRLGNALSEIKQQCAIDGNIAQEAHRARAALADLLVEQARERSEAGRQVAELIAERDELSRELDEMRKTCNDVIDIGSRHHKKILAIKRLLRNSGEANAALAELLD